MASEMNEKSLESLAVIELSSMKTPKSVNLNEFYRKCLSENRSKCNSEDKNSEEANYFDWRTPASFQKQLVLPKFEIEPEELYGCLLFSSCEEAEEHRVKSTWAVKPETKSFHEPQFEIPDQKRNKKKSQRSNFHHLQSDITHSTCCTSDKQMQDSVASLCSLEGINDSLNGWGLSQADSQSSKAGKRGFSAQATLEDLAKWFHEPINTAAEKLGVSNTIIKRLCRKFGIERWPYRQIRSLNERIEKLETKLKEIQTVENAAELLKDLQKILLKKELVIKSVCDGLDSRDRNALFTTEVHELDPKLVCSMGLESYLKLLSEKQSEKQQRHKRKLSNLDWEQIEHSFSVDTFEQIPPSTADDWDFLFKDEGIKTEKVNSEEFSQLLHMCAQNDDQSLPLTGLDLFFSQEQANSVHFYL